MFRLWIKEIKDNHQIKDITISDKNLKIYKVNNLKSEEYFDNSKDIIKENIKENKNDNFISKCNELTRLFSWWILYINK